MHSIHLSQIIEELVKSNRESSYWDFKLHHHVNKADLLHDIICLANSVDQHDKYLIYGISDPPTCKVKGVANENRRSQSEIIDFLRSKKFAGDIRPEIELKTISIATKEVDVLTIIDAPRKPYFLLEDYRDKDKNIKAHHIYTRNLDSNTPKNRSADLLAISEMWRERFGLNLRPAEYMLQLLMEPDDWDKDIGNRDHAYHKNFPEYQIRFGELEDNYNVYRFFYMNESSYRRNVKFTHNGTELFSLGAVYVDEMRKMIAEPEMSYVINRENSEGTIWYYYYELDSRNYAFQHFLSDRTDCFGGRTPMEGDNELFLQFIDEKERKRFEEYLEDNLHVLDEIPISKRGKMVLNKLDRNNEHSVINPIIMIKIAQLHTKWKSQGVD